MTVSEVNIVAQAFHDGVANRDAAALASLYAENARFMPPGMEPCEGRAQTQSAMQLLLDMGARSLDLEPLEVREADNLTIEYGRYTLGIEPEGSEAVTDSTLPTPAPALVARQAARADRRPGNLGAMWGSG